MNLLEYPTHIDIDLSTKCNLRCRFCHLSYYKPKSWTQLSLEQFMKLDHLIKKKAVQAYPVLVEIHEQRVAQAEHTFIPTETGVTVTTISQS